MDLAGSAGQGTAAPVLAHILTIWIDISGPRTTKNKKLSNGEEKQWGLHRHTDYSWMKQVCLRHSKLRSTCLLSNIFNLFNHCIYNTDIYIHTYMTHMYSCDGEIKMSAPLCPLASIYHLLRSMERISTYALSNFLPLVPPSILRADCSCMGFSFPKEPNHHQYTVLMRQLQLICVCQATAAHP